MYFFVQTDIFWGKLLTYFFCFGLFKYFSLEIRKFKIKFLFRVDISKWKQIVFQFKISLCFRVLEVKLYFFIFGFRIWGFPLSLTLFTFCPQPPFFLWKKRRGEVKYEVWSVQGGRTLFIFTYWFSPGKSWKTVRKWGNQNFESIK